MKKLLFFASILAVSFLGSCILKNTPTYNLTIRGWKIKSAYQVTHFTGNDQTLDLYAQMPKCALDDSLVFTTTGSVYNFYDSLRCPTNSPTYSVKYDVLGTWAFASKSTQVTITNASVVILNAKILELSDTKLTLQTDTTIGVNKATITKYYQH